MAGLIKAVAKDEILQGVSSLGIQFKIKVLTYDITDNF